ADRADRFAEQISLEVETAGVRETVAALQTDDQLPRCAGLRQLRRAIPCEAYTRRNSGRCAVDLEQKLRVALVRLRYGNDVAGDQQIGAFERRRQILRETHCAVAPGPCDAEQYGGRQSEPARRSRRQHAQQRRGPDRARSSQRQPRETVDAALSEQKRK